MIEQFNLDEFLITQAQPEQTLFTTQTRNIQNLRDIVLVKLGLNGRPLHEDVVCLAFSPSNQLFALVAPNLEGRCSLFSVESQIEQMQFFRKFAVSKIAFSKV
ncbi:hypothetical protein [Chroococcidiopsis sp.]|uniref:hypothetical protein n=1 Tax=Chroococcidiopsis sp. TaxID=3088168 RepID=UPI003F385C74